MAETTREGRSAAPVSGITKTEKESAKGNDENSDEWQSETSDDEAEEVTESELRTTTQGDHVPNPINHRDRAAHGIPQTTTMPSVSAKKCKVSDKPSGSLGPQQKELPVQPITPVSTSEGRNPKQTDRGTIILGDPAMFNETVMEVSIEEYENYKAILTKKIGKDIKNYNMCPEKWNVLIGDLHERTLAKRKLESSGEQDGSSKRRRFDPSTPSGTGADKESRHSSGPSAIEANELKTKTPNELDPDTAQHKQQSANGHIISSCQTTSRINGLESQIQQIQLPTAPVIQSRSNRDNIGRQLVPASDVGPQVQSERDVSVLVRWCILYSFLGI